MKKDKMEKKQSFTTIDWLKIYSYMTLLSGVDIAIQSQLSQQWQSENKISQTAAKTLEVQPKPITIDNQTTTITQSSFATTANQLFYSAFGRVVFLLLTSILCQQKLIPKKIQPHVGYIIGGVVYACCVHLTIRVLMDSELDAFVFNLQYIFLFVFNLSVNITVLFLVRKVVFECGVIEKEDKKVEDKSDKNQKAKDEEAVDGESVKESREEKKNIRIQEEIEEKEAVGEEERDKEEGKEQTDEGQTHVDEKDEEKDPNAKIKEGEEEDEEEDEGERDFENAERKIALHKMLLKLSRWYLPQLRWILLGYGVLFIKISSKCMK